MPHGNGVKTRLSLQSKQSAGLRRCPVNLGKLASMRIGLLSDTHGWLDPRVLHHFDDCDEIWHGGDIGSPMVAERLASHTKLRAVHGNIDGVDVRDRYPAWLQFSCEGIRVWMTHIVGHPPGYHPSVRTALSCDLPPDVLVGGHTHVLRVWRDLKNASLLYLNPGACGKVGIHNVRTLLKFQIVDRKIAQLQVIELGPRG